MHTRKTAWLTLLFLCAAFSGVLPAHAYYDPGAQRWLNRDPIVEPGGNIFVDQWQSVNGHNLYAFVHNSPTIHFDPWGNEIWVVPLPPGFCPPQNRKKWSCTAKCQAVPIPPNTAPAEWVEGVGSGSSESDACNAAKKAANQNVRRGFYKRHCDCTCSQGKES
jgi:RHS repeat-associated protein